MNSRLLLLFFCSVVPPGDACRIALSRKLLCHKYERNKPLLYCCSDKVSPNCKLGFENPFLFWWYSDDGSQEANVLCLLSNVFHSTVTAIVNVHEGLTNSVRDILLPPAPTSLSQQLALASRSASSTTLRGVLRNTAEMIPTLSKFGDWISENWTSATELTILCLVLFCLVITLVYNLYRERINRKAVSNFISQAGTMNAIANDLDSLKSNRDLMENLVTEIDSFHNGAKRQIIKKQVALTVLDQRLGVLRKVFRDPQETYQSLRDLVTKGQVTSPTDRELID